MTIKGWVNQAQHHKQWARWRCWRLCCCPCQSLNSPRASYKSSTHGRLARARVPAAPAPHSGRPVLTTRYSGCLNNVVGADFPLASVVCGGGDVENGAPVNNVPYLPPFFLLAAARLASLTLSQLSCVSKTFLHQSHLNCCSAGISLALQQVSKIKTLIQPLKNCLNNKYSTAYNTNRSVIILLSKPELDTAYLQLPKCSDSVSRQGLCLNWLLTGAHKICTHVHLLGAQLPMIGSLHL